MVRTPFIFSKEIVLHLITVFRFTNCVVYYGLSMSAGSLGGGRYLSLVFSGLVELPGLYVSYELLNRYVGTGGVYKLFPGL